MSQRFAVSKVSGGDPVDSTRNFGLCTGVRQLRQPIVKDVFPGPAEVVADFDHIPIVTYKSQARKPFGLGARRLRKAAAGLPHSKALTFHFW